MPKNLIIVESPSKSKTIEKYLGTDYKVVSSKGHVRDLATSGKFGFGVDIENGFKPDYKPIAGKKKVIDELKKETKKVDKVYLATDPDREGEAISWLLKDALGLEDSEYERITFNEITKDKVIESFTYARKIDDDLVRSQEARRILDRIIGFRLSKLMQKKVGSKSAGRVQSVALKLIVDREREINAFNPEEYWEVEAIFNDFKAKLFKYKTKDIEIHNEFEVKEIMSVLSNAFNIEDITTKPRSRKSYAPYITSTLQQDAANKISFGGKKTMSIAQKLYEGIDLKNETVGLITYMRTDSIRMSDEFVKKAYGYIKGKYGEKYLGHVKIAKKKDNVQDAHEAIRPTDINKDPESMKEYLSVDEYKLYKLIYSRAMASLMADALYNQTTVILDNHEYKFKATGSVMLFDGYLKVYNDNEDEKENKLPALENYHSKVIVANEIIPSQHFTEPPVRYTEARLIKELEEDGIGRPSTYSKIVETLKERLYVNVVEKKFIPTTIGMETTDQLQAYFADLINVEYTAKMENDLDEIDSGNVIWNNLLSDFYTQFAPEVENAFDKMEKKEPEKTGEDCPTCGSPMVVKKGRFGEFVACSNYPTCKYIKPKEGKVVIEVMKCPNCDKGMIVEKRTKRNKIFYGCNNYPSCKTAYWDKPTGDKCPKCGEMMVDTKDGIKCSSCEPKKK